MKNRKLRNVAGLAVFIGLAASSAKAAKCNDNEIEEMHDVASTIIGKVAKNRKVRLSKLGCESKVTKTGEKTVFFQSFTSNCQDPHFSIKLEFDESCEFVQAEVHDA